MTDLNLQPDKARSSSTGRSRWGYLISILVGFGLAMLFAISPYGRSVLETLIQRGDNSSSESSDGPGSEEAAGLWTCGMHPQVLEREPGLCSICGMNLVPVRAEASAPVKPSAPSTQPSRDHASESGFHEAGPVVSIASGILDSMSVVTETAQRRDLRREIRTVGYMNYDQRAMVTITPKFEGFVEKVFVNYLGQEVRKGEPLFEVYSPQLVQTEQELLSALEFAKRMADAPVDIRQRAEALVEAARTRLSYWDITDEQVARLESSGAVFRTMEIVAPLSGVVMKRVHGLEGMAIRPGVELIHIADLTSLWLEVEVFEDQVPWLRPGSEGSMTLDYLPGRTLVGRIRFVEPSVSEETRTVKVIMEVPNPEGLLRAGMFATVVFQPSLARDALAIPSRAVLRTGTRNVVVVALGNGRFSPREVELGPEGEGWVQILSGIEEGEDVVTSSQFLIDSESNLREAVEKMFGASPQHQH